MIGIFSGFRSEGKNISDGSLVSIFSVDFWAGSTYCAKANLYGGPAQFLVDGNESTAWANEEILEERQYVIISFKKHTVNLHSFYLETLCNPPASFKLEGSHDLLRWTIVHQVLTTLSADSIIHFTCQSPGRFRYFKLTQIGKCSVYNNYRFHLHSIEFIGDLHPYYISSLQCQFILSNSLHICIITILALCK